MPVHGCPERRMQERSHHADAPPSSQPPTAPLGRYILSFLLLALAEGLIPLGRAHAEAMSRLEAIRLVVERTPQVEAARNAYAAARAQARQAGALPDPELEFEFEEVPALGSLGDYGERTIELSQRVELPLKWWHRLQAGRQHAEAIRLAVFEMTKLDITLQAKQAYDRIALQKSLLQHAQSRPLLSAQNILRQAHIRFEAGDVPQLDVMRASVEVGRATNRLTAAQNDLSVAKTALNALLARPLQTPFAIADSLVYRPVETDLDQLTATALKQRPDLAGTELQLKTLQSQQAAATAAYWPDLNVGLGRQRRHGAGGHEENSWLVRFSLEVPLWAFSRQRGERAEAKAEVAKVAAERDASALSSPFGNRTGLFGPQYRRRASGIVPRPDSTRSKTGIRGGRSQLRRRQIDLPRTARNPAHLDRDADRIRPCLVCVSRGHGGVGTGHRWSPVR